MRFIASIDTVIYGISYAQDAVVSTTGWTRAQHLQLLGLGLICPSPWAKYSTTVGNGSATTFTLTHDLGTKDVAVSLYGVVSLTEIPDASVVITHLSVSQIRLVFTAAPASGGVRVVLFG